MKYAIKRNVKEGYKLNEVQESKSSQYFYIGCPDGSEKRVRISNHDACCVRSISDLEVLIEYPIMKVNIDFDELGINTEEGVLEFLNGFGQIKDVEDIDCDFYNCEVSADHFENHELFNDFVANYIFYKLAE